MAKSLFISYLLWATCGIFGGHHFYLGRDKHGLVWLFTFGGLGFGLLRDLFKLPSYVDEANFDHSKMSAILLKMKHDPPFHYTRYVGQMFLGLLFGFLVIAWLPDSPDDAPLRNTVVLLLAPLFVAMAVWLVGNIGLRRVSWRWTLLGAYLGYLFLLVDAQNLSYVALFASSLSQYKGAKWRRQISPKRSLRKRALAIGLCAGVFLGGCTITLLYRVHITMGDGETVPLRTALHNFFRSPAWRETKQQLWQLWYFYRAHGFAEIWSQILEAFDPRGEANAYETLQLNRNATQEEIKRRYKALVRQWHPDKQKDPERKEEASVRFMAIQAAYEVLSELADRRSQRNRQSTP